MMSATHRPLTLTCVCAWCGRWRDDTREWHDPPAPRPPDRPVTHGICPDCFADQVAFKTLPT